MEQQNILQEILHALEQHSFDINQKIDEKFDEVNERLTRVENRLDQVENRLDRIERKLDGFHVELTEVQESVDFLLTKSTQHERKLRELQNQQS